MLLLWKTPRSGMIQFHSETLAAELFGLGTLLNNPSALTTSVSPPFLFFCLSLILYLSSVYISFSLYVFLGRWRLTDRYRSITLETRTFPRFPFLLFRRQLILFTTPSELYIIVFFLFFFRTSLQALGLFYCHWIHLFYLRPILHVEHLYRYSAKKQHRGHYTVYSIGYLAVNARPRTKCMWKETRIYLI